MLQEPRLVATLERLHTRADAHDPEVLAHVLDAAAARGATSDAEMADLLVDAHMPVAPSVGRLLHALALARRPGRIVEFGCSMGLSTIYLAAALGPGEPQVVTTELEPTKVRQAAAHLDAAGLEDRVEILEGDALQTLRRCVDPISLLFLDGWKGLYLPVLLLLEPLLVDGALVIADDTLLLPDLCAPFLDHVRAPEHGYHSAEVALDDGLEIAVRSLR